MMLSDPIVAEVHEVRRHLFKEAGCDLHVFFQRLREAQGKHRERVTELTTPLVERHGAWSPHTPGSVAQAFSARPIAKSQRTERMRWNEPRGWLEQHT